MRTVQQICEAIEQIAPARMAMGNDPVGLLIGDPSVSVSSVLVALDVTSRVIEAAVRQPAQMIVAHHPLIYHPLRTVRADQAHPGRVVMDCVRSGVAVACAHTCWDVAPGGVNDVLAQLCGLQQTRPLRITCHELLVKVVVYVPQEYRESVLDAMANAGAGAIGDYDRCAFWTGGTGTFRPLAGASPFVGSVGTVEQVAEDRLEMICPKSRTENVVSAMRQAHPYEEVAYEVYPLENTASEHGIGRVGALPEAITAEEFLARVSRALQFDAIRLCGPQDRPVQVVAVCGGAGAELVPDAIAAGADVLVTADVRHHEFVHAEACGFLLMDAGHAATETPGVRELANRLTAALPDVLVRFVA